MRWAAAELHEQYATRFRDMGGPFLGYQRRKILHILAPGEVGGLESVVRSLASAQQAQGHLVAAAAVVDRESPEHPWVAAARAEGIPVYPCPIHPGRTTGSGRLSRGSAGPWARRSFILT